MKKEKNIIFLTIIILLVILIILVTLVSKMQKRAETAPDKDIKIANGTIETNKNYEEIAKDTMKEKLQGMGERDRMEYYISNFINLVEAKKYEEAYELLNESFKTNYFPTAGQFQSYVKEKIPSMVNLDFTNIERNGNIYILWVTITDLINGKQTEGKEYKFVIRENDFNDIELSFSVEE